VIFSAELEEGGECENGLGRWKILGFALVFKNAMLSIEWRNIKVVRYRVFSHFSKASHNGNRIQEFKGGVK
jgi:hypothetical protein